MGSKRSDLPLWGNVVKPRVLNDSPVDCQTSRCPSPQARQGDHEVVDEVLKVSISQPHPSLALLVPPVSLRLGHVLALALSMQFTTKTPLHYPKGKVEGASLREGGAEQSEAEGERVSLFIYRRLFRTLNGTQAPSVTYGDTSLSEGGLDNPSPLRGAVSPAGSGTHSLPLWGRGTTKWWMR